MLRQLVHLALWQRPANSETNMNRTFAVMAGSRFGTESYVYCCIVWCMPDRLRVVTCIDTHAVASPWSAAVCILHIIQQPPTHHPLLSVYCASSSSSQAVARCCMYIAHHPAARNSPPVAVCILQIIFQHTLHSPRSSRYKQI